MRRRVSSEREIRNGLVDGCQPLRREQVRSLGFEEHAGINVGRASPQVMLYRFLGQGNAGSRRWGAG